MTLTQEQATYLMMQGIAAGLPEDHRTRVYTALAELKAIVTEFGDAGKFAVGLLGAELAAEA